MAIPIQDKFIPNGNFSLIEDAHIDSYCDIPVALANGGINTDAGITTLIDIGTQDYWRHTIIS